MKQAVAKARGNGISIVVGHDSGFSRYFQDASEVLNQENEEEYQRVSEELAALAASAPTSVNEIETGEPEAILRAIFWAALWA